MPTDLIAQHLRRTVHAAAPFRMRWSGRTYGGRILGAILTGLGWLSERRGSRMPAYFYLAVTDSSLYAVELRFGASAAVKRTIEQWPLRTVRARHLGELGMLRLDLDGRTLDLEALDADAAASLIKLLPEH